MQSNQCGALPLEIRGNRHRELDDKKFLNKERRTEHTFLADGESGYRLEYG
jgi:hypothetical protein